MKIDIKHVAKLANLVLTDSQIKKFEKQLSSTLDYINKLQKVKTDKVEETSQVTGLENVTREDITSLERTLSPENALSNTSSKQNAFFRVKGVLSEK